MFAVARSNVTLPPVAKSEYVSLNVVELIYVEDLEEYYVQDAVTEVYDSYVNDMKKEVENELIEEGYEYEKAEN